MAIRFEDWLTAARSAAKDCEGLPDVPSRETSARTAIIHAYYAVYHAATERAEREGYLFADAPSGLGAHEVLWRWWYVDRRPAPELAALAESLRARRVRASYRLNATFGPESAKAAVSDADSFLELLSA